MYTNPSNLVKTVVELLNQNMVPLNNAIHVYDPKRNLQVYQGMRNLLPIGAYPSLEIEPTSSTNQWATTRSQRPNYQFEMTFTTTTDNEELHLEYHSTISTLIIEILTSPQNLQLFVVNESKWDPNCGLVPTRILDSLISDVSWRTIKDGTIRESKFNWFAIINETFPEYLWQVGESDTPTILKPEVIP